MKKLSIAFVFIVLTQFSCKNGNENTADKTAIKKIPVRTAPKNLSYTLENAKEWLKNNKSEENIDIVLAVNRKIGRAHV